MPSQGGGAANGLLEHPSFPSLPSVESSTSPVFFHRRERRKRRGFGAGLLPNGCHRRAAVRRMGCWNILRSLRCLLFKGRRPGILHGTERRNRRGFGAGLLPDGCLRRAAVRRMGCWKILRSLRCLLFKGRRPGILHRRERRGFARGPLAVSSTIIHPPSSIGCSTLTFSPPWWVLR